MYQKGTWLQVLHNENINIIERNLLFMLHTKLIKFFNCRSNYQDKQSKADDLGGNNCSFSDMADILVTDSTGWVVDSRCWFSTATNSGFRTDCFCSAAGLGPTLEFNTVNYFYRSDCGTGVPAQNGAALYLSLEKAGQACSQTSAESRQANFPDHFQVVFQKVCWH